MQENFFEFFGHQSVDFFYQLGLRLIYALVILTIGYFVIRMFRKILFKALEKTKMELSLRRFVESAIKFFLYSLLLLILSLTIGIKMSSIMTLIGAAGIAIGLALQGSLSNFAGGLLILVFKPFRIGDEIEIGEVQGIVDDINILYTKISDWRGQIYSFPNGMVSNNKVKNNSATGFRRIEIDLNLPLDTDFDFVRQLLTTEMKKFPGVLTDRPVQLWLRGFKDYYLSVSARCWSTDADYWGVFWGQVENIKKILAENKIPLTVPTQEIRLNPEALKKYQKE